MAHKGWPIWRCAIVGLAIVALSLSSYLAWHSLVGGSVLGCSAGSSCDEVLSSRWSKTAGGLPVAGLAMGLYLAMIVACLFAGEGAEESVRQMAWRAMSVFMGVAAGSAIWFFYVQKWLIGAFCPYCMATHVTGLLLAALVFWKASKQTATVGKVGRFHPFALALAGLGISGIVAASQSMSISAPAYRRGDASASLPVFDLRVSPHIGPPDARLVVTVLFDFKCPHCQAIHSMLDQAVRTYRGRLAFVLCPTPLNSKCNPYVPMDVDQFKGSCELARLALTVWAAKREVFPAFDAWMFSFESGDRWRPRSYKSAYNKAAELVGEVKLRATGADPWIDRYLKDSIRMYGATATGGNTAVPKMIFGSHWVIPQPENPGQFVEILQKSLGLPKP